MERAKGTTILCVRHKGSTVMGGDGQVTIGSTSIKHGAKKIRKLYNGTVLVGFSGAAADSLTLLERFEKKLEEYRGNLRRSAYELAREWRTDRVLRRLNALMVVADKKDIFIISGSGDLIEPDDGVVGIGSGGPYAVAAARALIKHSELGAREIVEESMRIAASICIYTNSEFTIEEI